MCQFLSAFLHRFLLISFSPHVCKFNSFKYRKCSPIIWIVLSFLTPFYSYSIKLEQKVKCKIIYCFGCHDDLTFFFCGFNVWFSLFIKSKFLNLIPVMHLKFFIIMNSSLFPQLIELVLSSYRKKSPQLIFCTGLVVTYFYVYHDCVQFIKQI